MRMRRCCCDFGIASFTEERPELVAGSAVCKSHVTHTGLSLGGPE